MATIKSTQKGDGISPLVVSWTGITDADEASHYTAPRYRGLMQCVAITGNFGGATVGLECSLDLENWFSVVKDGDPVEATEDAMFELTSAALYFRPVVTGGAGYSIDLKMALGG